jgi:hypothetical protein
MIVKEEFTHTYGHGGIVTVPAGARTERIIGDDGHRWVDPSVFPRGSIERHDAEYIGIRVPIDNTEDY